MERAEAAKGRVPDVDTTLTWVVVLLRLLGWVWMLALTVVTMVRATDTGDDISEGVLILAMAVATSGALLMVIGRRRGFLANPVYVVADGLLTAFLLAAGFLAGAQDFVAGGYPMSFLFLVAYATSLRGTAVAAVGFTLYFAWLHVLMDLEMVRVVGSIQFLVVALVAGWAFDAVRQREALRLEADAERRQAEARLAEEEANAARLEERSNLADRLHDSVLQTLKLIIANAGDADEVRYLARGQTRELRQTINEYRSPYENSFRTALLNVVGDVEDRYRVEVDAVIHEDAELTVGLEKLVGATEEALKNAARHSGSTSIDLYAYVSGKDVQVSVRDRGSGFDPDAVGSGGLAHSIVKRVESVGGNVAVKTAPGKGTEIAMEVPLHA